jgi:hypothetical protein
MIDNDYVTIFWGTHYKLLKVWNLYIEWWDRSGWGFNKGPSFFAVHIGHLALAWLRKG